MDTMNVKELRDLHYQSDSDSSTNSEPKEEVKLILKKFAPPLYSYKELENNLVLIEPGNKSYEISAKSDSEIYELISKELKVISKKLSCEICNVKEIPPVNCSAHFNGKRHKNNAQIYTEERFEWFKNQSSSCRILSDNNVTSSNQVPLSNSKICEIISKELCDISRQLPCKICNVKGTKDNAHFNGKRHKKNATIYTKTRLQWFSTQVLSDNKVNQVLLPESKMNELISKKLDNKGRSSNQTSILSDSQIYTLISKELKTYSKLTCGICNSFMPHHLLPENCKDHFFGENHKTNVEIYKKRRFEVLCQTFWLDSEIYEVISKELEQFSKFKCVICNISHLEPANCSSHFNGNKHQKNVKIYTEKRFEWLKNHNSTTQALDDDNVTTSNQVLLPVANAECSNNGSNNSNINNSLQNKNLNKSTAYKQNEADSFKTTPEPPIIQNTVGQRTVEANSLKRTPVSPVVQNIVEHQSNFKNDADVSLSNKDKNVIVEAANYGSIQEVPESSGRGVQRESNELMLAEEILESNSHFSETGTDCRDKIITLTPYDCKNSKPLDNSDIKENKLPKPKTIKKKDITVVKNGVNCQDMTISSNKSADFSLSNSGTIEDKQNVNDEVPFVDVDKSVPEFKTKSDCVSSNISNDVSLNVVSFEYEMGRFFRNAYLVHTNIPYFNIMTNLREHNESLEKMIKNHEMQCKPAILTREVKTTNGSYNTSILNEAALIRGVESKRDSSNTSKNIFEVACFLIIFFTILITGSLETLIFMTIVLVFVNLTYQKIIHNSILNEAALIRGVESKRDSSNTSKNEAACFLIIFFTILISGWLETLIFMTIVLVFVNLTYRKIITKNNKST